jgi:hypothetical protein
MLIHAPVLCLHFTADVVTPFFLIAVFANMGWRMLTHADRINLYADTPFSTVQSQLIIAVVGAALSIGVRQIPHFRKHPKDLLLLPGLVVILTVLMTTIRIAAFMVLANDAGWGTRPNAYPGTRSSAQPDDLLSAMPLADGSVVAPPERAVKGRSVWSE